MHGILDRMIRAARLDINLYEEVEADRGTMTQAMLVVVLASVAAGLGTLNRAGGAGIIAGTLFALAGWYLWAFLTYIIGTRLLPEPQTSADYGELLRTIGFSGAPGVVRLVGVIPGLWLAVNLAANIWMLAAIVLPCARPSTTAAPGAPSASVSSAGLPRPCCSSSSSECSRYSADTCGAGDQSRTAGGTEGIQVQLAVKLGPPLEVKLEEAASCKTLHQAPQDRKALGLATSGRGSVRTLFNPDHRRKEGPGDRLDDVLHHFMREATRMSDAPINDLARTGLTRRRFLRALASLPGGLAALVSSSCSGGAWCHESRG